MELELQRFHNQQSAGGLHAWPAEQRSAGKPLAVALREKYYGLYVQDDYQITRGLDLHVGVRWEPIFRNTTSPAEVRTSPYRRFWLDKCPPCIPTLRLACYSTGTREFPLTYANRSYDDFAPRVGSAWDPNGKGTQSFRGSYGIFFDKAESYTQRDWGLEAPGGVR